MLRHIASFFFIGALLGMSVTMMTLTTAKSQVANHIQQSCDRKGYFEWNNKTYICSQIVPKTKEQVYLDL